MVRMQRYLVFTCCRVQCNGSGRECKEGDGRNQREFSGRLSYEIPFDMTTYISESIHEVYKTLFEAWCWLCWIVYLSLQSWRATLIPGGSGTYFPDWYFRIHADFGFSINILTLLGLILAIGIVVDDAIVVVEEWSI